MKTLPLLVGIALTLSACTPAVNSIPATGPLAESFSGRGAADLQSVTAPVPIMAGFGNATTSRTLTVGTLNTDRTVSITVTAEMMANTPTRTLATDKSQNLCDTSGVRVQDAAYSRLNIITFTSAGQKYGAQLGTKVMGTGGVRSDTLYEYWYARQAGSYVGTSKCGPRTLTWNIQLMPGWNRIANTTTYNTVTGQYGDSKIVSEGVSNLYDGPWTTYKL